MLETSVVSLKYITVQQATELFNQLGIEIDEPSLRRKLKSGKIPFYKPFKKILFLRADIDSYLDNCKKGGNC